MISIKLHRNLIETSTRQRSQTAHLPSLTTSEHQAGVSPTRKERRSPCSAVYRETQDFHFLGVLFERTFKQKDQSQLEVPP